MPGKTGVWVGERKIAAIGVRISMGIACHGAALNVSTELGRYRHIVPCGTPDREVTSMHRQLAGASQWRGAVAAAEQQQQRQQEGGGGSGAAALEAAAAAGGAEGAPSPAAPSLQQVADCFRDAFAAQFGYHRFEALPDVNALAAAYGCTGA